MNRIWLTAGTALVVVGAAVAGATEATARTSAGGNPNEDLIVTLVTPTINQEVLPDLGDPGLNNVITVRFSAPIRPRDFISTTNVFNRLTPAVEFLNSKFERLAGEPVVTGNVFRFDPRTEDNGGVLPNGQYTLNIKSNVRSRKGKLLNQGLRDFSSTFSVGTDFYAPVLREMSPIEGQLNIGLFQKVIATFNEPISASSLLTTVTVHDVGTSPPTQIFGANGSLGLTVERNGFDIVFTPDPCFGYPPKSTIEFKMQGRPIGDPASPIVACQPGNVPSVTAVTDVFNNQFTRDAGLQWAKNPATGLWDSPNGRFEDCTGIFRTQFQTRGIVPPPAGLVPGSSQYLTATPCGAVSSLFFANRCDFQGRMFLYTTGSGLGEVDLTGFIQNLNATGQFDFTKMSVVQNSPVRMGRPAGLMVDPRWDPNAGNHTFIYLVDQRAAAVNVVDSRNLKVLGRLAGFSSPRDVGMSTDVYANRVTLYVSDFGARQCVALDLTSISVSLGGQPGAASPCDAIKDNAKLRVAIPTGPGPSDVAGDSFLNQRVMVVNTLDSSVTLIDAARNVAIKDYEVGGNPLSCDFTMWAYGAIDLAAITNQGGLSDPNGSVSMYVNAPPLQNFYPALAQTRDGIDFTFTEGVKNPTYVWANQEWQFGGYAAPQAFYVANTGGKTVLDLRPQITGVFGLLIDFRLNQAREVGFNPTGVMLDPYYPTQFLFAAVAGEGRFVGMDPQRNFDADGITVPGIRRLFSCYSH